MKPVDVFLCAKCSEDDGAATCVCCNDPHNNHKGVQVCCCGNTFLFTNCVLLVQCKQCSVKGRFKCGRCGEGVKQSRVVAQLCDKHGLGSRAKECCRMKVTDSFHQTDLR